MTGLDDERLYALEKGLSHPHEHPGTSESEDDPEEGKNDPFH